MRCGFMNEELLKILQIRYVKLHFIVMFTEDSVLFPNKVSALRGGIGEMLLQMQRKGGCREIDSPLLEIKRRKSFWC